MCVPDRKHLKRVFFQLTELKRPPYRHHRNDPDSFPYCIVLSRVPYVIKNWRQPFINESMTNIKSRRPCMSKVLFWKCDIYKCDRSLKEPLLFRVMSDSSAARPAIIVVDVHGLVPLLLLTFLRPFRVSYRGHNRLATLRIKRDRLATNIPKKTSLFP